MSRLRTEFHYVDRKGHEVRLRIETFDLAAMRRITRLVFQDADEIISCEMEGGREGL